MSEQQRESCGWLLTNYAVRSLAGNFLLALNLRPLTRRSRILTRNVGPAETRFHSPFVLTTAAARSRAVAAAAAITAAMAT